MSAYAALVSLMNTMDHIQIHPRISNCFDKKQMESLSHHITFLLDFVEITHSHSHRVLLSNEYEVLESQITSAAHAAEDVIESHVVNQIQSGSISLLDLQTIIQDMDSVKDNVVNFKEGRFNDHQQSPTYSLLAPSTSLSNGKSKMVAFDEELIQLLDALTGRQSSRQVIPIVGMGGIGKTTLARNAYESRLILNHFDVCGWATISQEYSMRDILSKLVSCIHSLSASELGRKNEQQLAQQLYQSLIGRRYLIILDDIWSIDVWDQIKFFFPDKNNGSRIIITTRLSNVAIHFGSYFSKKFLDKDKSWKLFCEKVFQQDGSPPTLELEETGKKIAKKCKGLPLLIVVIGGLLRNSTSTHELWEKIAKDINLIPNLEEEEQNLDILSLSYSHLPAHLKPCFLYMGIYPEDHEIHVSELVKLWVAEGFIKPNKTQSLEEVAECYLKDLVDRNLVLVGRLRLNGKIKTCTIHDLLRYLCIKAAQKEKFLYLMRFCDNPQGIVKERRILFHENFTEVNYDPLLSHTLESAPLTRSLLGNRGRLPFKFRLLRVLNVIDMKFDSLNDVNAQVNLRYFYKSIYFLKHEYIFGDLPQSISLLWNVQTLKFRGTERYVAPSEIWSMPQLRHLDFAWIYLPDPPLRSQGNNDVIVLTNLQTLKKVTNLKLSEEVCKRIPNVKKLTLNYEDFLESSKDNYLYNIGRLHKLESLNCHFGDLPSFREVSCEFADIIMVKNIEAGPRSMRLRSPRSWGSLVRNLEFPTSLKELTLRGSDLHWEDLTTIGLLPNLEVLKLNGSIRGYEWNPVEGHFLRLKFLFISSLELTWWNAESVHFPVLENLRIVSLSNLDEIPSGIGEIPTLQAIQMFECSESANISSMRILEEQESLGNDGLRVLIEFVGKRKLERFKKKVENFESFKSNNLQFKFY